jgi:hypothetical protein
MVVNGHKNNSERLQPIGTMCDFVCEKPLSNRANCLFIKSRSRLERAEGIEPSFTRAVPNDIQPVTPAFFGCDSETMHEFRAERTRAESRKLK